MTFQHKLGASLHAQDYRHEPGLADTSLLGQWPPARIALDAIFNCGLAGALQIAPRDGDALIRPFEAGMALWKAGFYVRFGGDTLQFGPTFNTKPQELDRLFG